MESRSESESRSAFDSIPSGSDMIDARIAAALATQSAERAAAVRAESAQIEDLKTLVHQLLQTNSSEKADNISLNLQLEEKAAALCDAKSSISAGSAKT